MIPRAPGCLLLAILLPAAGSSAEPLWLYHGLGDRTVRSIKISGSFLYAGTDAGVYRKSLASTDTLWTSVGLSGVRISALAWIDPQVMVAGGRIPAGPDTAVIYRTTDGGASWNRVHASAEDFEVTDIEFDPSHPDTLYAGQRGRILKSTDGGLTWGPLTGLMPGIWNDLKTGPGSPGTVWAGGENLIFFPVLARTTDGGASWADTLLRSFSHGDNAVDCIQVDPVNANMIFLGMEGLILRSLDGGASWQTIRENSLYNYDIEVDPCDASTLYSSGFGANPPDNESVYLFISGDHGDTWTTWQHRPGNGLHGVLDLEVKPDPSRSIVYLAGRGVYEFRGDFRTGVPEETPDRSRDFLYPIREVHGVILVRYRIGSGGTPVTLALYDVMGRKLRFLDQGPRDRGEYEVTWRDDDGSEPRLSRGVYWVSLDAGPARVVRRFVRLGR